MYGEDTVAERLLQVVRVIVAHEIDLPEHEAMVYWRRAEG